MTMQTRSRPQLQLDEPKYLLLLLLYRAADAARYRFALFLCVFLCPHR